MGREIDERRGCVMGRTTIVIVLVVAVGVLGMGCNTNQPVSSGEQTERVVEPNTSTPVRSPQVGPGSYTYLESIGGPGDQPGQFHQPVGLAVGADSALYVSDTGNKRLQKLDAEGNNQAVWADGIARPMHLSRSTGGQLVVAVFLDDRIEWFEGTEPAGQFGGEWLDAPSAAAQATDGRYYVADFYHHQLHIVLADGQRQKTVGEKGKTDGQFTYPTDVAIDAEGRVWVADAYAHRLQTFDADGRHLQTIGGWGKEPGKFQVAIGIDIGPDGKIYVADFKNHRIQVLQPDGQSVAVFGQNGTTDDAMRLPTDVVATEDRVYVVDHGHHQIDVYSMARAGRDQPSGG